MAIVVVTGSAGLIGSETVKRFHGEGFDVVGIDNDMRAYFFGNEASTSWNRERSARIVVDAEFPGRAQHAARFDTPHRCTLDQHAAGQHCAFQCTGREHAGDGIRRAAHDLQRFMAPDINLTYPQTIGVGMRIDAFEAADHDMRKRRRDLRCLLDLETGHRKAIAKGGTCQRRITHGAQPLLGKFHRKRAS